VTERIAFVGAGAVGGSVAADLIEAGVELSVFDQWPAHVDAMRADGLAVTMPGRRVHVEVDAHHLCDLASIKPTLDIVFSAVDAYDARWVARLVEPYLASDGVLVGIQNSMTIQDHEAVVGRDRTLGCVVELSAEMFEPAVIQRNTDRAGTWIGLGELDGTVSSRAERLADMLSVAATTAVTTNIRGAKWTKLVANCMMMGPYLLFGLKEQEASRLAGMSEISARLGAEAAAVGEALGYTLEPIFGLTAEDFAGAHTPKAREAVLARALNTLLHDVGSEALNTMIQDQLRGRRTEYQNINGLVAFEGARLGVPTPASDAVTELSRQIEAGRRPMTPDNLDVLKALLSEG
jgi:2-dehydropantoate 2-reductase